MSYTELLEPILRGGIRSVNFFNGRLLSAEDLKQEQDANREGRARLGQAVGHGVAYGLEVVLSAANTAQTPVVTVGSGLAVNREGRTLKLTAAADLALVQQPSDEGAPAGQTFKDCRTTQGGVYLSGAGVYLLTVAPAEGSEGRAPFSGLGETVVTCNTRYRVEGVRFRLVRLLTSDQLGTNLGTLRSRVAYECLGAAPLRDFERNPLAQPLNSYGLLDSKRPAQLADDEVPLAVVYWATTGVGFVDNWSVRRPVTHHSPSERFEPLTGERRGGESLAAFLHFQEHLAAIQSDLSITDTASLKADDHLAFLPPVGLLPTTATRGFNWRQFLGPHAPARETQVDEGLLRAVFENALPLSPVKLNAFASASSFGASPPAPYAVYRVPGGGDFALFARSPRGRLRVFVTPPSAPVRAGQVYAEDAERTSLRLFAHVEEGSGLYPVGNLEAGSYTVRINAPGVFISDPQTIAVVGGRTTDVLFTVNTPGSLLLTIQDAEKHESIGGRVKTVTLTREGGGGSPLQGSPTAEGKWIVNNVPPGTYTVRVTADEYVTGEKRGVEIIVATNVEATIELQPVPVTTGLVKLEIHDQLSQARIDNVADDVKAASKQNGAVVTAVKVEGIWTFKDIEAGAHTVTVKGPNYKPKTFDVTVAAKQVLTIPVTLEPVNGKLVVTLTDKNTGAPITSAEVKALGGSVFTTGTKVGNNVWEIGVPPGAYTIVVTAANYNGTSQGGLLVAPGGSTPVTIQLDPVKGTVRLSLTWPSGFKLGAFEAIVTPANQASLPAVTFDANDTATVGNVPAGTVSVRIRPKTSGGPASYPDTNFNLTVAPGQTAQRTVGLPSEGISYSLGEDRPQRKPRSHYSWTVNGSFVEAAVSSPYSGMTPAQPARMDVKSWLASWRDWLILTRPDLGLDPTAPPKEVSRSEGQQTPLRQKQVGRVIFFRPGGSTVGMGLSIVTTWEIVTDEWEK
ncbi:MAG TPA: hypothetical protein VGX48_11765 [Pyrinomonadaceae bacterium]|jgi:hypothetical protein|nr:hypothetical protein [Pyrinomonadaceae bacterium]